MNFDKDFDENQSFDMPNEEIESNNSFNDYEEIDQAADETTEPAQDGTAAMDDNVEAVYYAILLAILALFGYVMYKIYSYLMPIDEREIMPAPPAVTAPAPVPVAPVQPAPVVPKPVVRELAEPRTITRTVVQSAGLTQEDKQELKAIETNLEKQKDMIDGLSKDNDYILREHTKVQRDIEDVNKKLDTIISKLQEMTKPKEEVKAPKAVAPPKPLYTLFIRAMVDGRAWLVDEKGATATVIVGHELKDYGTVEKILVNQGIITTSSGRIIKFKKAR